MAMKCFVIAALASSIVAVPQNGVLPKAWDGAASGRGMGVSDELLKGPCKDIFFIMARATMEPGNLVRGSYSQYLDSLISKSKGGDLWPDYLLRP